MSSDRFMGQSNPKVFKEENEIVYDRLILVTVQLMPLFGHIVRRLCTMASGESAVSGTYSMAFVTVPNRETAKSIASQLVTKKLAACVNIIPQITSIYEWEGKIEEDEELLLMIKTRTSRVDELAKFVSDAHPYDCPEVISSLINNGNPSYLKWLGEIVPEKPQT